MIDLKVLIIEEVVPPFHQIIIDNLNNNQKNFLKVKIIGI